MLKKTYESHNQYLEAVFWITAQRSNRVSACKIVKMPAKYAKKRENKSCLLFRGLSRISRRNDLEKSHRLLIVRNQHILILTIMVEHHFVRFAAKA